jgi:hypothetical protein
MQVMAEREVPRRRSDFVQIDDAYLGGERNGGKPGRGSAEQAGLPDRGANRFDARTPRSASDAEMFSDGLFYFRRFADTGHAHTVLQTSGGPAACEVKGARWVNVLLSNVKRAISGSCHAIRQGNYARLYLAEAAYRFNRRFDLRAMLPLLARAMMALPASS